MVCYFCYSKTACSIIAKQLMYLWLNSTESIGVWGIPPEKFEKLNPLHEIKSEGIFNSSLPGLQLQDSTLQND